MFFNDYLVAYAIYQYLEQTKKVNFKQMKYKIFLSMIRFFFDE